MTVVMYRSQQHGRRGQRIDTREPESGIVLTLYIGEKLARSFNFCVAYTKCKPLNAIAEDIYSCICHGEQNGCHVVYCGRNRLQSTLG